MKGLDTCPVCGHWDCTWNVNELGTVGQTGQMHLPCACNDCDAEWTVILSVVAVQVDSAPTKEGKDDA